jgi:hypothetical protein
MKDVRRDFQERCNEINLYFSFLENIITKDGKILYSDKSTEKIDPILIKTFKANGFLLLYNLTESSIKKAVEAIFEEIIRRGVKYEEAKDHIKIEFIKFIKKVKTDEFVLTIVYQKTYFLIVYQLKKKLPTLSLNTLKNFFLEMFTLKL